MSYVDLMKASIAHGIRPTALILGKDSGKPWSPTDILFAKSYQRFLNEICQQCGLPKYICHSSDNRIQFKLTRDECASTARAEMAQESASKDGNKEYGTRFFGEPYLVPEAIEAGIELSDFRRPYQMERAKIAGVLPEDFVTPEP